MEGFTKLTEQEKHETKGGFAWLAAIPAAIEGIATIFGLFKSINSNKGTITVAKNRFQYDNSTKATKHTATSEHVDLHYFH